MKRSEFINRFKRLRANTGFHGNCGDINRVFFKDVLEVFRYVFSATTVLEDENGEDHYIFNLNRLFWLSCNLESIDCLSREDQETQRVIAFELFYHYVLTEQLYEEF